jgi:hypothetical protein
LEKTTGLKKIRWVNPTYSPARKKAGELQTRVTIKHFISMKNTSIETSREVTKLAIERAVGAEGFQPQPSYLRRHVALVNSKTQYDISFNSVVISATGANADVVEVGLEDNDMFVITDLGIYLSLVEKGDKGGTCQLYTYANPVVFPDVTNATSPNINFLRTHLNAVYNGSLAFKIGGTTHLERMEMMQFRYVPETQQNGANNHDQFDTDIHTVKLDRQLFIHGGAESQKFVFSVPEISGLSLEHTSRGQNDNGKYHKLVIIPRGFLIKGAAGTDAKQREERNRKLSAALRAVKKEIR